MRAIKTPTSKSQTPDKLQNSKTSISTNRDSFWDLGFEDSLVLGAWDLGFKVP
jgi:hypothetical protein